MRPEPGVGFCEEARAGDTDDLIKALVARHRSVEPAWLERRSIAVVVFGIVVAAALIWPTIGFRRDLVEAAETGRIVAKYTFLFTALVIAGHLFVQLARPGRRFSEHAIVYVVPVAFVAFATLVQISLMGMPTQSIVLGDERNWIACLAIVPILSSVPFAGCIYILRRSAPTDLPGAGFSAGVFAGTIAAAAYAAHCPCDMPVFVGLWYPLAFLVSGIFGACAAPRLTRW
jgi:hypothetical protein